MARLSVKKKTKDQSSVGLGAFDSEACPRDSSHASNSLLSLQRTLGNRGVGKLLELGLSHAETTHSGLKHALSFFTQTAVIEGDEGYWRNRAVKEARLG